MNKQRMNSGNDYNAIQNEDIEQPLLADESYLFTEENK